MIPAQAMTALKFCVHPADPMGMRVTIENCKAGVVLVTVWGIYELIRRLLEWHA